MQTISGDRKEIIKFLDQFEFIDHFAEQVLIPLHFVDFTGETQVSYEEFLENKQVLSFSGKGERIHDSFLVKMYLENRNIKKIRIQTSFPEVFKKTQHIRKRYLNFVDIEFHGGDFVDVQKRTMEYTLFFDNIFIEQNTGRYMSIESYKGTKQISKIDNIPYLSPDKTQNLQKKKERAIIHT